MASPDMAPQLRAVLDELWRAPAVRKERAAEFCGDLSSESWLVLAAWDSAATCGPVRGRIEINPPRSFNVADELSRQIFSANLILPEQPHGDTPLLTYGDGKPIVVCSSGNPVCAGPIVHDASSLLVAMQIIRDHLESALLKPRELREVELNQFAELSGCDRDHFRRLAVWQSEIAKFL